MREASCRALEVIERGAAAEGVDYRQLISGLPVPLDRLLDRSEWIDWDVLAEICDRFERAAGPGAMLRAGRAGMRTQLTKPLLQVAGLVVDIRHLYTVGMRWLVPLTFQNLVIRLDPVGRDELRVEVQIPREFRGSSAFLRIWPVDWPRERMVAIVAERDGNTARDTLASACVH